MPRLDDSSVQAVREGADLVELVRSRVALHKRGGRWVGRCPFHEERTPSFSLLPPDSRRYYCHGCGATGDAFDWMQQQEGAAGFTEAVIALAERFSIPISYAEESAAEAASRAARERRATLLDRAAAFYAEYLWRADDAEPARRHLAERGIAEDLARRFRVGFAPPGGDVLSARALSQGFTRDHLTEAGLARARAGGLADFFVGRITFPIADARGRVQGFGARTLDPNERAKYVNSPEGPEFRKRHLLFGLAEARAAAARNGWIVVAEGYTDVLGLVASGVEAAVACMGTSLTAEQLRLLARWAGEVRLCFDADGAGRRAAWRSVEAARGVPVSFSAVVLEAGIDPGDLGADATGRQALARAVERAEPLLNSLIVQRVERAGRSARDREAAVTEIAQLLRNFPDGSIEKDDAIRLAADRLDLSPAGQERLRRSASQADTSPAYRGRPLEAGPDSPQEARELRFLVLAHTLPRVARPFLQSLSGDAFTVDAHREAFALLSEGRREPEEWPESLAALGARLRAEAAAGEGTEAELRECTYRLQLPMLRRRASALRAAGDERGSLEALEVARRVETALRGAG